MARRDDQINVRVPDGMRDQIKEKAAKERRSVNSAIVLALEAWLSAGKAEDRQTA